MNVQSVMTAEVVSINPEESLLGATRLLREKHIKHLPVVDGHGHLIGIVTDRDLKRASASEATTLEIHELMYLLDKMTVDEVMTRNPLTIPPSAEVREAARLLLERNIGCLPVLRDGVLAGIVTSDDLLRLIAQGESV